MTKSPQDAPSGYPEQRLAGLRRHAAQQRQATLERLQAAIASLKAKGEVITVHTVRETSGLDYKSYARNPEALCSFKKTVRFLPPGAKRREGNARKEHLIRKISCSITRGRNWRHASDRKCNVVRRSKSTIVSSWRTACSQTSKSCNWRQNSPSTRGFLGSSEHRCSAKNMMASDPSRERCNQCPWQMCVNYLYRLDDTVNSVQKGRPQ